MAPGRIVQPKVYSYEPLGLDDIRGPFTALGSMSDAAIQLLNSDEIIVTILKNRAQCAIRQLYLGQYTYDAALCLSRALLGAVGIANGWGRVKDFRHQMSSLHSALNKYLRPNGSTLHNLNLIRGALKRCSLDDRVWTDLLDYARLNDGAQLALADVILRDVCDPAAEVLPIPTTAGTANSGGTAKNNKKGNTAQGPKKGVVKQHQMKLRSQTKKTPSKVSSPIVASNAQPINSTLVQVASTIIPPSANPSSAPQPQKANVQPHGVKQFAFLSNATNANSMSASGHSSAAATPSFDTTSSDKSNSGTARRAAGQTNLTTDNSSTSSTSSTTGHSLTPAGQGSVSTLPSPILNWPGGINQGSPLVPRSFAPLQSSTPIVNAQGAQQGGVGVASDTGSATLAVGAVRFRVPRAPASQDSSTSGNTTLSSLDRTPSTNFLMRLVSGLLPQASANTSGAPGRDGGASRTPDTLRDINGSRTAFGSTVVQDSTGPQGMDGTQSGAASSSTRAGRGPRRGALNSYFGDSSGSDASDLTPTTLLDVDSTTAAFGQVVKQEGDTSTSSGTTTSASGTSSTTATDGTSAQMISVSSLGSQMPLPRPLSTSLSSGTVARSSAASSNGGTSLTASSWSSFPSSDLNTSIVFGPVASQDTANSHNAGAASLPPRKRRSASRSDGGQSEEEPLDKKARKQ